MLIAGAAFFVLKLMPTVAGGGIAGIPGNVSGDGSSSSDDQSPERLLEYIKKTLNKTQLEQFKGAIRVIDPQNPAYLNPAQHGARVNGIPVEVAHYLNLLNNMVQLGQMSRAQFDQMNQDGLYLYQQ